MTWTLVSGEETAFAPLTDGLAWWLTYGPVEAQIDGSAERLRMRKRSKESVENDFSGPSACDEEGRCQE